MPISCSVKQCKSRHVKGSRVTFHKFPKDPVRRALWVKNLGREKFVPGNSSNICSKHFEEDCFDREKFGGTWLKSTAVPTIFCFKNTANTEDVSLNKDSSFVQNASSLHETTSVPITTSTSDKERNTSNSKIELLQDKQKDQELESKKDLKSKRKRISYLGDFKDGVSYTTEELHLGLQIANKLVKQQNKKIRGLKGMNNRLRKRVETLDATLEEYRKKVYIPSDVLKAAVAENKKNVINAKTNSFSASTKDSPLRTNGSTVKTSGSTAMTNDSQPKTNGSTAETNDSYDNSILKSL